MFRSFINSGMSSLCAISCQTMQTFPEYISFEAIVDVLVSKRVQLGDKLHKKHMLHLLSPSLKLKPLSAPEKQLLDMMPSRKHWVGMGEYSRYRKLADGVHTQRRSASECNRIAIKRTIENDKDKDNKPPYIINLEAFVGRIQHRVQSSGFKFDEPTVFPEKKDDTSCRPLCKFTNLEDSVIIILANKYLSELFNGQFYDESLAFRSKRTYHGQADCVTSHHDAILRIKEYRAKCKGRRVYVSECDLQKFYDTVSHRVVRKCYQSLLKAAAKNNPGIGFAEISRVFEAFLNCYSFPRNVYGKNHCPEFWEENKIDEKRRCFKWAEKELLAHGVAKSHRGLMQMRIGVPQGGALSGLIANMVLNTVDFEVNRQMTSSDLYLRYCDDMIILSTSRSRCQKLFSTYYEGAKRLKLVPHAPEKRLKFGKAEFWKGKSKNAYLWAMNREDAAEWIGFVGYEMRRDGVIRIRRKSFRKELDKQRDVVFEKLLDKIRGERVSDGSLIGSLERKLVSMSVGKIAVWNAEFAESEMCWAAGFRELEMNPVLKKQLRELDRHRGMMLSAAARRINRMQEGSEELERKDVKQLGGEKNPDSRGKVHSYYYQFERKKPKI